ncbi:MAG TPA: site-specific DNA-methyltransferase [Nanoarchaeota archaeon]|nr:site-specific DNA-methyltransferase [Nanoarchaeota archaeon]
MKTTHTVLFKDARSMDNIQDENVDLIVTSPPYPMIQMWDEMFSRQNPKIGEALSQQKGELAFELIHKELDKVWSEVYRVLKPGGIACINIGDATRTLDSSFRIYPNHARILNSFLSLGFHALPSILWVKETNKPDKFMGSGMLPVGAYVTLEHEHILILRKGHKREFKKSEEKLNRQKSAFFWEERNLWFSDKWKDINGLSQKIGDEKLRERSAAYPFELAYRLINMFSVQGDTVLDPFLGTGTTTVASIASSRNSFGIEIDPNFGDKVRERIVNAAPLCHLYNDARIRRHKEFVEQRQKESKELKYINEQYQFPVMTRQELGLKFPSLASIQERENNLFEAEYN